VMLRIPRWTNRYWMGSARSTTLLDGKKHNIAGW